MKKRTSLLRIRLTALEHKLLKAEAKKRSMPVSVLVRSWMVDQLRAGA